jgi:gamma-glutamylcyclotransferase (GGCT)/AIG2-like uncharacterized protein YtfP
MKIFVYGALMDDPRVQATAQVAQVRDHTVRFTAKGFTFLEPRFLALEKAEGDVGHGVVAEVSEAEWDALSAHEDGYDIRTVTVTVDGHDLEATALVLQAKEAVSEGLPSGRYADRLVRGGEVVGLPDVVLESYRRAAREGSGVTRWIVPVVALVRSWVSR